MFPHFSIETSGDPPDLRNPQMTIGLSSTAVITKNHTKELMDETKSSEVWFLRCYAHNWDRGTLALASSIHWTLLKTPNSADSIQ